MKEDKEIVDSTKLIAADPFLETKEFQQFMSYRKNKRLMADGKKINPDSLITNNPSYYLAWSLSGDYYFKKNQYKKAASYYSTSLTKEIATLNESNEIHKKLKMCNDKISE